MPAPASRYAAAPFDQQSEEHRIADWGGDELFTRMPRPRPVDDAPPPRFRPAVEQPGSAPRRRFERVSSAPARRFERVSSAPTPGFAHVPSAPALALIEGGLAFEEGPTVEPVRSDPPPSAAVAGVRQWEPDPEWTHAARGGAARPMRVITGRPDGVARPQPPVRADRRRPTRTPMEWLGGRPERLVAWAFVLGLLLILIAIATADAATV